tara:strand:- start:159 stop:689 length:531 start_codon:yes stop_codon:yes gene_type:complete
MSLIPPLITNLLDFLYTEEYNCPICLETHCKTRGSVTTKCNHNFCITCYTKHSSRGGDISCPICRQEIIVCDDSEKEDMSNREDQIEDFSNLIDETIIGQNTSKMNFSWNKRSEENDEITFHAWIFCNKIKESSRSNTPIVEVTDEKRQEIFKDSFEGLQADITRTWERLETYRPT